MIFKHKSLTYSRENMSELTDKHGAEGYGVMWIIFEKIASQAKNQGLFEAKYSLKKWAADCCVSHQKFKEILDCLVSLKIFRNNCEQHRRGLIITIKHILPSNIIETTISSNLRGTSEYKAWRKTVFKRDRYTCQECGKVAGNGENGIDAHHIKSYADYPDLRTDVANGLTLCTKCHQKIHGHYQQ